jgi:predicted nucleic acid-binding protein
LLKPSIFTTPLLKAHKTCIEFILKGRGYPVLQSLASLSRAALLMAEYKNVPVDFADAALVVFAEMAGIDEVLALDGATECH